MPPQAPLASAVEDIAARGADAAAVAHKAAPNEFVIGNIRRTIGLRVVLAGRLLFGRLGVGSVRQGAGRGRKGRGERKRRQTSQKHGFVLRFWWLNGR